MSQMSTMSSDSTMMAIVCHLSNIPIMVVGVVVDMLDPAIGKVDRVMSLSGSCSIAVLLLIKSGSSVAISNSVVVVVRNNVIDFVSISKSSMAKSMTDTDAMASMVTNVSNSKASMSSGKAANLGRGGWEESRDVDEDLHSVNCLPILPM